MNSEQRKKTEELLKELKYKKLNIQDYIDNNPDSFIEVNLKEYWHELIEKSNLSNFDIINKSDFSYVYFYDVIAGKKIPTTDKIVRLILAMHLSIEDCQQTLKFCGKSQLYPRFKRDSILIYAINQSLSVAQTQILLKDSGEEPLK